MSRKFSAITLMLFVCALLFSSCTKKPSKEELSKLEEARSAALSAEKKLSELRTEREQLESQLDSKKKELKQIEDERDKIKKKIEGGE